MKRLSNMKQALFTIIILALWCAPLSAQAQYSPYSGAKNQNDGWNRGSTAPYFGHSRRMHQDYQIPSQDRDPKQTWDQAWQNQPIQLAREQDDDWDNLNEQEQRALRRYRDKWQDYSPEQRTRLHDGARHYLELSPEERENVEQEHQRFKDLSPEERQRLRERYRKSHHEDD